MRVKRDLLIGAWALAAASWMNLSQAQAVTPATSRGQQLLQILDGECLGRAQQAFRLEGWGEIGQSGNFVGAAKAIHRAYITCNTAPGGGVWVNIFVASDSLDGNVPGAERVRLQARMDQQVTQPPPQPRQPPPPPSPSPSGCHWFNGQDSNNPSDTGRGVQDHAAHRNHVLNGNTRDTFASVQNRLTVLRGCMSREGYARLYADVSVRIAASGRASLRWVDGQDPAGGSDPGRGVSSAQAHANYVLASGPGAVPELVASRLRALGAVMRTEDYAQLYADISVMIARAGA